MTKKKPATTPTGDRIQLSVFAVAIHGGNILPEGERGPLDTDEDTTNPLYDERLRTVKMTPEWVQSFEDHGVKQDVEITYVGDRPFLVDGRERIRGARLASRKLNKQLPVWCRVVTLTGAELLLEGLLLNMHHADTVPVKISKTKRALAMGLSEERIAPAMGVTPATIKTWMTWDKRAIEPVKSAVMDGRISSTTGFDIGRMKKEDQEPALNAVLALGKKKKAPGAYHVGDGEEGEGDGPTAREGSRTADAAAIANALGKRPVVAGKKGLKALLRAIKEIKLPKNADDRDIGWWAGCEDMLELLLGVVPGSNDGKRLDALVNAGEISDSTPEADEEEVPEVEAPPPVVEAPKAKRAKKAPPEAMPPPVEEAKPETVRQRQVREANEKKASKK